MLGLELPQILQTVRRRFPVHRLYSRVALPDPRTGGRGAPGRDHWDHCMSALLAGGVQGGQIYGSSDPIGGYPTGKPVLPEDLARTVYHAMGIDDHQLEHRLTDGRPVQLLTEGDVIPVL